MDIKITDLPAKATPLSPGDLFEVAEDQGSGNFISKKVPFSLVSAGSQGPQGPAGPQGPPGLPGANGVQGPLAANALIYRRDTPFTNPGNWGADNTVFTSIAQIQISKTSYTGYNGVLASTNNAAVWLASISTGDTLQIVEAGTSTAFGIYTVVSTSDAGTAVIFNVSAVSGQGGALAPPTNYAISYVKKGASGTGADVTLSSAGGAETLVNDGSGPSLAVKGISAGTGITLSSTGTDVTITNSSPNVVQNVFTTFSATTGSTTANTSTDTLSIIGTNGVKTSIGGDTLTINGAFVYEIGQYVASEGGVVFHRWLSTTAFGTPTMGIIQNYLIVGLTDVPNDPGIGDPAYATIDVLIPNVGSEWNGFTNTTNLIAAGALSGITAGTAAVLADTWVNSGKSDWYLPASEELRILWSNKRDVLQGIAAGSGTPMTLDNRYWSSTQYTGPLGTSDGFALYIEPLYGYINYDGKSNASFKKVRAIRRISLL